MLGLSMTEWQQWATVAGLVFDLVGFALLAYEWHRAFTHAVERRNQELEEAYDRNAARERKKKLPPSASDIDETMAVSFSRMFNEEMDRRRRLFVGGAGMIILGFALQVLGALSVT